MNAPAPLLEARGLRKSFGSLVVTDSVDLVLEEGARHALIGPNGAGKTTLVNLLAGSLAPDAGALRLDGHDVTRFDAARRARAGVARTFQINQLFERLPVFDNVALAVAERNAAARSMWRALGSRPRIVRRTNELLDAFGLADVAGEPLGQLPYGRQRLVEIAIAIAIEPRVLLLDEPAAGVPSGETQVILDVVDGLDARIAVLIIEHDMDVVFRFAREITVLVDGRVYARGTPAQIAAHDGVNEVYLGARSPVLSDG
ncbi:MAG: ATP-binding cassette domain-containing protein [Burkholderiaceae bacterium]|nr:ATP-binding cassette domain-containing protein [Burkholderiaceae bacterium]